MTDDNDATAGFVVSRNLDKPRLTWNECTVGDYDSPEGVVVALPHSADRLDVGVAIHQTIWGAEFDPGPGDVTIRAAWAHLFTLREQWEWEVAFLDGEPPYDDPPEGWVPDASAPAWIENPDGEQVWIAEWTT